MKKLFMYAAVIASYIWVSKKLKDKESNLSQCLKKMENKVSCMINDFLQSDKKSKKEPSVNEGFINEGQDETPPFQQKGNTVP